MTLSQRAIAAAARAMEAKRAELQQLPLARIYKELAEAGLSAALAVDGLCLAPVEPSLAMLDAGEETFVSGYSGTPVSTPHNVWKAMIAAANDGEERR